MKDYTLLQHTWKSNFIQHSAAYTSLQSIDMSKENRHLLQNLGLPFIDSARGWKFLPFTFYYPIQISNKKFYFLGDISAGSIGKNFLGLELGTEEIYYISQHRKGGLSYEWMNQSLYQYLMCLAYYTNFINNDYLYPSVDSKAQVRADYQKLKENMTQVDALAMADRNCLWADIVYSIQVGGLGDYFSDFDYEISEPLTPEEQERIDKMDLPF